MIQNLIKNGSRLLVRKQTSILSAAGVLIITVLFSAFLGIVRDRLLVSTFFGSQSPWLLDIYYASFKIPDLLFQILVAGTLSAAFIPLLTQAQDEGEEKTEELAATFLTLIFLVFLVLLLLAFLFLPALSRLIAPTFTPESFNLLLNLSRLIIISQFFLVFSSFLTSILHTTQRFLLPALAPVVYNLGIILGIVFLSKPLGIYGPVIGVILGAVLHFSIQLPFVLRAGHYLKLSFKLPSYLVNKILKLSLPRTLNLLLTQLEQLVATRIATSLTTSSLTFFTLAQNLNTMPIGLFGVSLGQATLPTLAKESKNPKDFKRTLIASINQIAYLTLPISSLLLILRVPLVRLAFGARAFPWQATLLTAKAVAIFSFSIFAQSLTQLLIRAFYALHDTKTPFLLGLFSTILMVSTSFTLAYSLNMGILGLVTAITLSSLLLSLLLFINLHKKLGGFSLEKILIPVAKILFSSLLMAISLWGLMHLLERLFLDTTKTFNLIILTLVVSLLSGLLYLLICSLLKVEEQKSFFAVFYHWRELLKHQEEISELPKTS